MARGRRYSAEFKQEAVTLVTDDHPVQAVARQIGIPQGTLWRWVLDARAADSRPSPATDGMVDAATHGAALKRKADLEQENEFLGKASAFFAAKVRP